MIPDLALHSPLNQWTFNYVRSYVDSCWQFTDIWTVTAGHKQMQAGLLSGVISQNRLQTINLNVTSNYDCQANEVKWKQSSSLK